MNNLIGFEHFGDDGATFSTLRLLLYQLLTAKRATVNTFSRMAHFLTLNAYHLNL